MILKIGATCATVNGRHVDMNDKFDRRNVAAMILAILNKKEK